MKNGTRGTIAGMATSTCGTATGCHYFTRACLNDIYRNGDRILGRVVFNAKAYVIPRFAQDTLYGPSVLYTLFGDPALRLKYPLTRVREDPGRNLERSLRATPNPFFGSTWIRARGQLTVYNSSGRKVAEMSVPEVLRWLGQDAHGRKLPAGVYFLKEREGGATAKVTILN